MIIRRSQPRDWPVILGFSRFYTTSPYTFDPRFRSLSPKLYPAFAEKMIQSPNAVTLVADEDGRIAGNITVSVNTAVSDVIRKKTGGILLLAVDERLRGRGIGRRLVQNGLKVLTAAGVQLATVVTDIYNTPAIRVYESVGFKYVLSWHIFRFYQGDGARRSALQKSVAPADEKGLDQLLPGFRRPISLLKDATLDRERRDALRGYFIRNLKRAVTGGKTAAFQYNHRNKPAGLLTVTDDEIARRTLATGDRVCKILDLIVPDGERGVDAARRLLADCAARQEGCRVIEIWTDACDQVLITAAEQAGYHLSYTGVAYHLT